MSLFSEAEKHSTDHLNQVTTYEYDGLGRLKTEAEENSQTQYTYEQSSNRIKKNVTGTTPTETDYAYDANDHLIWERDRKSR